MPVDENGMINEWHGILREVTDTYLNVAEVFAYRSTCIKRKYGADEYVIIPATSLQWHN